MFKKALRFVCNLDAEYLKAYRHGYLDGMSGLDYNPRVVEKKQSKRNKNCFKKGHIPWNKGKKYKVVEIVDATKTS